MTDKQKMIAELKAKLLAPAPMIKPRAKEDASRT
jgi:hypothetical protein